MVTAQYRLLTEGLKVNHLQLVMGTSMGGMHTWMWGETYPDFMDGLVPLASVPTQIAGRNRMWRKMIMDSIRNDPGVEERRLHDAAAGPRWRGLRILRPDDREPDAGQKDAPTRDAADALLARADEVAARAAYDANDMLYQFDASREYDPSAALERDHRARCSPSTRPTT